MSDYSTDDDNDNNDNDDDQARSARHARAIRTTRSRNPPLAHVISTTTAPVER